MRLFTIGVALALLIFTGLGVSANPTTQQEVEQLKAQIQQMTERLRELEQKLAEQEAQAAAPAAPATNLPQISVVANGSALFQSRRESPSRNRFEQSELEIAFQSFVYPSIRFDTIVAFDKEEDFAASIEEAYATVVQLGNTPFGARLGRLRLPFGRLNPIHPHHLLHQDIPLPILNLVGEHGAISNGGMVKYLLPTSRLYAELQVGLFTLNDAASLGVPHHLHGHEEEHEHGRSRLRRGEGEEEEEEHEHEDVLTLSAKGELVRLARFTLAPLLGRDNELEIGLSGLTARARNGDKLRLLGVDFQYRRFFGAAQRLLVAGEWIQHRREHEDKGINREGYYLLLSYKPDRYWEYGLRYDWSRRAFVLEEHDEKGSDRALSAILTYRLNEQSYVRLQWRNLKPADGRSLNEMIVQLVFGFGPHSHPLESTQ